MTKNMPPLKSCIGCGKYKPLSCYMRSAYRSPDNEEIYCPCIDCLVKSMCNEICDQLATYSHGLYEALYEHLYSRPKDEWKDLNK